MNPDNPAPTPTEPAVNPAPEPAPAPAPEATPPAPAPTEQPAPVEPPAPTEQPPAEDDDPTTAGDPDKDGEPDEPPAPVEQRPGINQDGTIDPEVYAADQLQEVTIRGRVGNGKIQEYSVKLAGDLPEGFTFADGREQAIALEALSQNAALYQQGVKDATEFNEDHTAKMEAQQTAYRQRTEIEKLQEEGKLPKFALKPDDPKFMESDEAKRVQAVLNHMTEVNKQFADAGLPDRITSVAVALQLLEAKEIKEANEQRMNGITERRNAINGGLSNGTSSAAPDAAKPAIYQSTAHAAEAAKARLGNN